MKLWRLEFKFRGKARNEAIRKLATEVDLPVAAVSELIAEIEANSLDLAKQIILQAKREAAKRATETYVSHASYRGRSDPPENRPTSGARLAG